MALTIGSPGLALYSIPVVWFTAFYPSFVKVTIRGTVDDLRLMLPCTQYLIMATTIGYNKYLP